MVTQMLFIYTLFKGHFCILVVSLRFIVTYKRSPSKSLAGFLLNKFRWQAPFYFTLLVSLGESLFEGK